LTNTEDNDISLSFFRITFNGFDIFEDFTLDALEDEDVVGTVGNNNE